MILAGITVGLCGKAQSCSNTLVDVGILQNETAIKSLYNKNISCTNNNSKNFVNQFIEIANNITNQSSDIMHNEAFKFNYAVSFNDRNMNDSYWTGIASYVYLFLNFHRNSKIE